MPGKKSSRNTDRKPMVLAAEQDRSERGPRAPARDRHLVREDMPWPWLAPLFVLLAMLYFYPLIEVVRLSFTDAMALDTPYHYSLSSYKNLFSSNDFLHMLRITAIFASGSIAGHIVLGLLIAELVRTGERRKLPGAAFVRSVVMMGWVLPGVVIGIVWQLLLDESSAGILTYFLSRIGVHDAVFLSASGQALLWATIANIWRGTAFTMVLLYAGMKTIPIELYEAATVDGANYLQQFFFVTLPSLHRILVITLILNTISTLNTFDMILPLTGGGPGRATEVVALFIYNAVFGEYSFGRGATAAAVLLAFGLVLTLFYFRFLMRNVEEST
jgi:multiple sugar transport system permease protein